MFIYEMHKYFMTEMSTLSESFIYFLSHHRVKNITTCEIPFASKNIYRFNLSSVKALKEQLIRASI